MDYKKALDIAKKYLSLIPIVKNKLNHIASGPDFVGIGEVSKESIMVFLKDVEEELLLFSQYIRIIESEITINVFEYNGTAHDFYDELCSGNLIQDIDSVPDKALSFIISNAFSLPLIWFFSECIPIFFKISSSSLNLSTHEDKVIDVIISIADLEELDTRKLAALFPPLTVKEYFMALRQLEDMQLRKYLGAIGAFSIFYDLIKDDNYEDFKSVMAENKCVTATQRIIPLLLINKQHQLVPKVIERIKNDVNLQIVFTQSVDLEILKFMKGETVINSQAFSPDLPLDELISNISDMEEIFRIMIEYIESNIKEDLIRNEHEDSILPFVNFFKNTFSFSPNQPVVEINADEKQRMVYLRLLYEELLKGIKADITNEAYIFSRVENSKNKNIHKTKTKRPEEPFNNYHKATIGMSKWIYNKCEIIDKENASKVYSLFLRFLYKRLLAIEGQKTIWSKAQIRCEENDFCYLLGDDSVKMEDVSDNPQIIWLNEGKWKSQDNFHAFFYALYRETDETERGFKDGEINPGRGVYNISYYREGRKAYTQKSRLNDNYRHTKPHIQDWRDRIKGIIEEVRSYWSQREN